ncbi:hypothetical protein OB2597_11231 [Pseudooceanicola batsensis HTCC2597]|uniref:DUF3035 domain-containing protein n=1 Tax=Pseudooceanicola batsensis (strain ATCC BAA-863 / DSM 15984 / KCTC 12145 / HTCC2597) TaxID=252305 RepID=A3TW16_PSEBH|nr:hypothetical protein OB2597_11231 [Pseudooceanicola batsensis HTCC2597]
MPLILIACTGLAACGGVDRDFTLRKIRNTSNGPEEFTIVPGKPLETPPSFVELPPPTPGGANRTDQQPIADAVAALGGNPSALEDRGIAAADGALVSAASRRGVDSTIRQKLAQEDEELRRRKHRFARFRIFGGDEYYRAYDNQTLDSQSVKWIWRRAGAQTPSAPPER